MHEINVHAIANFQRYVQIYGLPKLSIRGLGQIYERALVALTGKKSAFRQGPQESKKSVLLEVWR